MGKNIILSVRGMVCGNCEKRIEAGLTAQMGIKRAKASFQKSMVEIEYDENVTCEKEITETIKTLGYDIVQGSKKSFANVVPLMILVFAGYYILENTVGFNALPEVTEEMSYGLIFMVGVLTSLHCIAMCGGIALTQSVSTGAASQKRVMPSLLYNLGRVISYTLIGGIVGGVGQILTPSGQFKGIIAVFAGFFMVLLGMRMLNLLSLPEWLRIEIPLLKPKRGKGSNPLRPLMVGLFNGFMPCGPLQTMQLYALGTASVTKGALVMFFFSVGTVPLMLGFGAIAALIHGRLGKGMAKASGVLVMILGLIMLNRGLALSGGGFSFDKTQGAAGANKEIRMEDGKQVLNMTVGARGYVLDTNVVQAGIPVKIYIDVQSLNGCNNPLGIPAYGIEKDLKSGESIIEFTPTKEGPITISCWMGMITTRLTAVKDLSEQRESASGDQKGGLTVEAGSCGVLQGENKAEAAVLDGGVQKIEMTVGVDGYSPNILVVQKGLPTIWQIYGKEINVCTKDLSIPDAGFIQPLREGKNEIRFTPEKTGEILFACGMNMLMGKIVIVDDLNTVDLKELEAVPMPPPSQKGGCCN